MLKIHKSHSKKLLLIPITTILGISSLLGLIYYPNLTHAETANNNPYPPIHPNLEDITYMQDMTAEVCQNTYGHISKQLIDKRDNKTYWVTKLMDGNCWMTQNLGLNLSTSKPLSNLDSDVENSWTPTANTQTDRPAPMGTHSVVSYNPGEYVYTTPLIQDSCMAYTSLSDCTAHGWKIVTNLSSDLSGQEETHYLAGNYYSFNAAIAGGSESLTEAGTNAPNSICPKGWQLPAAGLSSNNTLINTNKTFTYLFDKYGWTWSQGNYTNTTNGNTIYDLRSNPFYFLYTGYTGDRTLNNARTVIGSTNLFNAGNYGEYWSSTVSSSYGAYSLGFDTVTSPSNSVERLLGFSVRCVAKGEPIIRPEVTHENNVSIAINPTISLDVTNEVVVEKNGANPSTAALSALVASNQPYSININSANPALTSSTSSITIPSKSGLLNTAENAWGIKLSTASAYEQITTTPKLFYSSSSPESKSLSFTIGISTAPDIPNGEYSTNITVTATQN